MTTIAELGAFIARENTAAGPAGALATADRRPLSPLTANGSAGPGTAADREKSAA
jgi:hypothetical protein